MAVGTQLISALPPPSAPECESTKLDQDFWIHPLHRVDTLKMENECNKLKIQSDIRQVLKYIELELKNSTLVNVLLSTTAALTDYLMFFEYVFSTKTVQEKSWSKQQLLLAWLIWPAHTLQYIIKHIVLNVSKGSQCKEAVCKADAVFIPRFPCEGGALMGKKTELA